MLGLFAGLAVFVVWLNDGSLETMTTSAQRLAFVGTGFVVAAFNLRFKLLEAIKADEVPLGMFKKMEKQITECTGHLSILIVFFVISSAFMAGAPLAAKAGALGWIWCSVSYALLAAGIVQFMMIIFTFDAIEKFTISRIKAQKTKEERDRLLAPGGEAT